MEFNIEKIRNDFECAVHSYMMAFCEKHGYYYDPSEWVCGEEGVGGVICVNDMFLDFDDIRHDINTNQPNGQIEEWHDYTTELYMLCDENVPRVNYKSWCMGYKPFTPEQLQAMKIKKMEIECMKEELHKMCGEVNKNF